MQNSTNTTQKRILVKIEELKAQLDNVGSQIETERAENSEEDSAIKQELLDKQEIIESQIQELESSLQNSEEIKEYGKSYNLEINGRKRAITIVHPAEADPTSGKISLESPLAKALIGRKAGDKIAVDTPAGMQTYLLV